MRVFLKVGMQGMEAGTELRHINGWYKLGDVNLTKETVFAKPDFFRVEQEEKEVDKNVELPDEFKTIFGM